MVVKRDEFPYRVIREETLAEHIYAVKQNSDYRHLMSCDVVRLLYVPNFLLQANGFLSVVMLPLFSAVPSHLFFGDRSQFNNMYD